MSEAGEESTPHRFRTRPHYWPRSTPVLPERGLRSAPPHCRRGCFMYKRLQPLVLYIRNIMPDDMGIPFWFWAPGPIGAGLCRDSSPVHSGLLLCLVERLLATRGGPEWRGERAIWARCTGRICSAIRGLTKRGTRSPGLAMSTLTATAIFTASSHITITGRHLLITC